MAKNQVLKTFVQNGSWTAPAGVTSLTLTARRTVPMFPRIPGNAGVGSNLLSAYIDPYGNAYAWGLNTSTQCKGLLGTGDGASTSTSSPVLIAGGQQWQQIFAPQMSNFTNSQTGQCFGAINKSGQAYMWGYNGNGSLGNNGVVTTSTPTLVVGGYQWGQLSVSIPNSSAGTGASVFGITLNGTAYAWGINALGQLGIGNVTPQSSPVAVLGGLTFQTIVSQETTFTGYVSVMGLTTSGALYGWGGNTSGELGVGDTVVRSSPVAVLGGLTFASVVAGSDGSHAAYYALTPSGQAYAWGGNSTYNLGTGDNVFRSSPVAVLGGLTFKALFATCSSGSVYGITTSGQLYAWGGNGAGILGIGNTTAQSSPVAVLGGLTFQQVIPGEQDTGGGSCVFGLTTSGQLYAWGTNANGGLGVGDVISRSSPVAVLGGITFRQVQAVNSGGMGAIGVSNDGKIYGWGYNQFGACGTGAVVAAYSSPVLVVGGPSGATPDGSQQIVVPVIPGQTYNIVCGSTANPFFGGTSLLPFANSITLEYFA